MIPLLEEAKKNHLTANEQILFDYINHNPKIILHQNLQFICNQLFISNATIIRFCQKLGFRGFNEFKFELRNQLYEYEKQDVIYDSLFDRHLSVFKDHLNNVHFEQIEKICALIQSLSTVYIYGSAMSSIPAHYLHSVLSSLDYRCIFVEWRHLLRGISENTDSDTLLIMITSHGANERYEDILSTLAANHTHTVIITDQENNLFKKHGTIYINTKEEGIIMHNVDYSYKLQSLIIVQIIIEMIYNNRQQ